MPVKYKGVRTVPGGVPEMREKKEAAAVNAPLLQYVNPPRISGQIIGKIAGSYCYIMDNLIVEDLLRELNDNPEVTSVGVVDDSGTVAGVVTRDMFFDILGRPFGRDLYKNKRVKTIMLPARHFRVGSSIFSVADDLSNDLRLSMDRHYILLDEDDGFAGIFTNRDLLVYLSEISRREMDFAKSIQSGIVPEETFIAGNGCVMLAATAMAKEVGGDYYHIEKIDEANWFLSVCDVSGKGISAALLSVLMGGINFFSDFSRGIRDYVIKLNRFIYGSFRGDRFMTGVFAVYNETSGKINIFDAGHSLLFICRDGKMVSLKSASANLPLGIVDSYEPVGYTVNLKSDDILIIITDGIEGQSNQEGDRYGMKRVHSICRKAGMNDMKGLKDEIFLDIRGFRGHQAQDDDMTMLILRVNA